MTACRACREDVPTPEFTMAFQPIVDVAHGRVFAYEALVRSPSDPHSGAAPVLAAITDENRYAFDQACRVKAIHQAARLGMKEFLSINFLPNAVYQPAACLRKTLEAARQADFPMHHLVFEVTESEPSRDASHLKAIFSEYKKNGMLTAIDDFGAGHSNLNMLAEFQPDIVKIDMGLTRDVGRDRVRHAITQSIVTLCQQLQISVVCEGIQTLDEAAALRAMGVRLMQGYLFARPAIDALPPVDEANLQAVQAPVG